MIEGLTLAKIAKAIGIKGFAAIGLAIALIGTAIYAHHVAADLEAKRNELAAEKAGHAITRQSVTILQQSLEQFVGAGHAARVAQLAAIEAQAKDSATLQAQAEAIRKEMAAAPARAADPDCRSPRSVINAKGL
jgi:septal ring factor EnvC (AmiA/AmiB activator)